jgi:DNA end-binding protein Ku
MILECAPLADPDTGEISYAIRTPVSLRGASEKKDVTFDNATEDGNPIKRIEIDGGKEPVEVEVEREVVHPPTGRRKKPLVEKVTETKLAYLPYEGEKVKGVRTGDEFFAIKPEEVEQIEELTKLDTLTINEFILAADVPWERAQACYYLAPPKGVGAKTLATLRDAMEAKGVVGVAKLMPKSRQKLAIIYPKHGGLMVTCLSYADTFAQVVDGAAAIGNVEINPKVQTLLEKVIAASVQPVTALDEYRDDLIDYKADLIERAKLGTPLVSEETAERELAEVSTESLSGDALMERLQESLDKIAADRQAGKAPSRERAAV